MNPALAVFAYCTSSTYQCGHDGTRGATVILGSHRVQSQRTTERVDCWRSARPAALNRHCFVLGTHCFNGLSLIGGRQDNQMLPPAPLVCKGPQRPLGPLSPTSCTSARPSIPAWTCIMTVITRTLPVTTFFTSTHSSRFIFRPFASSPSPHLRPSDSIILLLTSSLITRTHSSARTNTDPGGLCCSVEHCTRQQRQEPSLL